MAKKSDGLKIKVVGCGGIGTCLLDTLCRYLNYSQKSVEVSLIDGDVYEERNRERQIFEEAGPKATVTAERLKEQFQRIAFWDNPYYLTEENVISTIRNGDFVFSCVDNHKTRKLLSDRAEELDNVVIISGGNELEDGNLQVHIRENGENITLPIANVFHPEIMNPKDKNPGHVDEERKGCDQMVVASPQLVIMNNLIAANMLSVFYSILNKYYEKSPQDWSEWYLDMKDKNCCISRPRKVKG